MNGETGPLPPRLLGEPRVEQGAREANVPADPMTGQAACPYGLIDPARLDVEIPGSLIWPKEPVVLECQGRLKMHPFSPVEN